MNKNGKPVVAEQAYCTNLIGGTTTELNLLLKSSLNNVFNLVPVVYSKSLRGLGFLKAVKYYKKEFKRINPDLIVIRGCEKEGLAAQIGAKLAKKGPVVVGCHGLYSKIIKTSKLKHFIALHIIEPMIFKKCDCFYTVSKSVFDQYKPFKKYETKYIGNLYNVAPNYNLNKKTDCQKQLKRELGISESSIVGIYHGRLTYDKGAEVLISALRESFNNSQNCKMVFLIVGEVENYLSVLNNEFKQEIHDKRLFIFPPTNNIEYYLLASDFYVHPSYHDNHSMSLLEACSAGCFVISTDVGGVRETVISENSQIVNVGDYNAIANRIALFCCNKNLFDPLIWKNKKYFSFSEEKIYKEREILYKNVISKY